MHFIVSSRNANILGARCLFFFHCSRYDCGRYGKEKTTENKAKKSYNEQIKGPNDKTVPQKMDKITKQSPVGCVLNALLFFCCCCRFFVEKNSRTIFLLHFSLSCSFQWNVHMVFCALSLCFHLHIYLGVSFARRNDLKFHFKNFYI